MLIEHPRIYLDATGARTDALLIEEGVVRAIGDRARDLASDETPHREPDAACLFPALADAHIHLWGMGQRAGAVDLDGTESPEDVYERLASADRDAAFTDWLIGQGFNDNYWEPGARLSRERLDAIAPNTPICLFRSALHAAFVNSEALRRAGIDESFRVDRDGRAERDEEGRLTGLLVDEAMAPIHEAIPPPSEEEDEHLFRECADMLLDHGIASAHMAKMSPERLSLLRRLRREDDLPIRVSTMIDGAVLDYDAMAIEPFHDPEAWCSASTIKFFADGALGSQGGLVLDTYKDGSEGLEIYSAEEFRRIFPKLTAQGWSLAVHAIGDRAARNVLDGFAACPADERERTRPRLEHAQMMASEDIERMGDLSAVASIQPIHLRDDCTWAHEVLEPFQLDRLYEFDALAEATRIAGGSDYPVADANPWHGISCAMTRRTRAGDAFFPEKALGREQILAAYTSEAAYAAHWEDRVGQLHPGFEADVIALDRDPLEASAESIWETNVVRMWLEGERCR